MVEYFKIHFYDLIYKNFMTYIKKISVVIVAVVLSCNNPFATRSPEEPTEDRYTWVQPIIPELVLDNLKYSLIEANPNNYMECLTDIISRFHFTPDAFVEQNYSGLFSSWNLSRELTRHFTKQKKADEINLFLLNKKTPRDNSQSQHLLLINNFCQCCNCSEIE